MEPQALIIRGPQPAPLFNMNKEPSTTRERIQRSKDKVAWRDAVYYATLAEVRRLKLSLPLAPSNVQIELGVPDARIRDPHNYERTAKPMIDALVLAKLWPDDNPQFVSMQPIRLVLERVGRFIPNTYTITITPRDP